MNGVSFSTKDKTGPQTEKRVYNRNSAAHKADMSPAEVARYYSEWSENYEQDLCEGVYNGPTIAAKEIGSLYPCEREAVRILDVASGTGLLGEKLFEIGFRKLSALDPAEGMLEVCKRKNIYDEFICEFMSGKELSINNDAYDCIAVSGGMGESHLPSAALSEMIRVVKPGGHVCLVMREEYLENVTDYNDGKLESLMGDLERQGKWIKISRKCVPNYSFNKDGIIFVFQVK